MLLEPFPLRLAHGGARRRHCAERSAALRVSAAKSNKKQQQPAGQSRRESLRSLLDKSKQMLETAKTAVDEATGAQDSGSPLCESS